MMLTGKQMKTYRFIRRCILVEGRAPTYHRIAENLGVTISVGYAAVTRICERGRLKRRNGKISLSQPVPTTTEMFDYYAVDYRHLTTGGWPRLVDLAVAP